MFDIITALVNNIVENDTKWVMVSKDEKGNLLQISGIPSIPNKRQYFEICSFEFKFDMDSIRGIIKNNPEKYPTLFPLVEDLNKLIKKIKIVIENKKFESLRLKTYEEIVSDMEELDYGNYGSYWG